MHRVIVGVSLCNKIVISDYYPWCEDARPERWGWSYCGAQEAQAGRDLLEMTAREVAAVIDIMCPSTLCGRVAA